MNLLSVREIIRRELIKIRGNPIKNHDTLKEILTNLGIKTVKKGKITYYVESDLYRKLEIEVDS